MFSTLGCGVHVTAASEVMLSYPKMKKDWHHQLQHLFWSRFTRCIKESLNTDLHIRPLWHKKSYFNLLDQQPSYSQFMPPMWASGVTGTLVSRSMCSQGLIKPHILHPFLAGSLARILQQLLLPQAEMPGVVSYTMGSQLHLPTIYILLTLGQ